MHCTAYIATSLDGFIARTDGSLDWLEAAQATIPAGEDCGYAGYMATVDAIVMGRHTYDKVRSFTPWPYDKPVYVLSRTLQALPAGAPVGVQLCGGSPTALAAVAARHGHHLYIDGGLTVQAFIAAGLLQEITITRIPVLLGQGLPLFGPLPTAPRGAPAALALEHLATRSYPGGLVQSHYRLLHGAGAGAAAPRP